MKLDPLNFIAYIFIKAIISIIFIGCKLIHFVFFDATPFAGVSSEHKFLMELLFLLSYYVPGGITQQEFVGTVRAHILTLISGSVVLDFSKFQVGLSQMSERSWFHAVSCQMIRILSHRVTTVRIFCWHRNFGGETCCSYAFVSVNLHKTVRFLRKYPFL